MERRARGRTLLALIVLRGVSVHVKGHRALDRVDWTLEAGDHWAISGPNGSGKSTLLRVIAGEQWIDPDGGERHYRFDGIAQGTMAAKAAIRTVSPELHEHYARLELPIRGRAVIESGIDNALYVHRPLDGRERRTVDALIERLGLGEFAETRVNALSFGQLRRLLIARAAAGKPRVIVLDEYTNGLDAEARADVLALVDRIAADAALVLSSHRDDDFVPAVTRHARMANGRIVERGPGAPPAARMRRRAAGAPAIAIAAPPLVAIAHADVYRGSTRVLADLSWSIARGEHTAVTGANGSGKSTFAAVVAGTLVPAFGGEVRRSGSGGPFDVWRIKETIVHVSEEWQTGFTVDHPVEDVVLSGFASSVGLFRTPTAAERRIAAQRIEEFDLRALRDRPFRQLSFGERRKVLIARALVRVPALLILDEVWNGLDAAFRERLDAQLHDLAAGGTTLLLVAHHADDLPDLIVRRQRVEGGAVRS